MEAEGVRVTTRDTERLDWAENNPEAAMREIIGWWSTCGPGCREVKFHFRNVIDSAMEREAENPP